MSSLAWIALWDTRKIARPWNSCQSFATVSFDLAHRVDRLAVIERAYSKIFSALALTPQSGGHKAKWMTAPLIPAVWFPFVLNLFLQVFDGLMSYAVLSEGVPEANPLVSRAISEWGVVWGLFYSKTFACVLLLLIFAFRNRRRSLTIKAFTVTAAVYGYVSIASLTILLLHFTE